MIALRSVTFRATTGEPVIEDLSLELGEGQVALITGPTGSGKTALVRLVMAAARPHAGQVLVFGHDVTRLRRSSIALLRRRLALVPQEAALLEDESALANVAAPLAVARCSRRDRRGRAMTALERFGLEELAARPVSQLSAGQRRRVGLARAAAAEPAVLVADDPTAHLDVEGRAQLLDFIADLAARGGATLVASHDPALAAAASRLGWTVKALGLGLGPMRGRGGVSVGVGAGAGAAVGAARGSGAGVAAAVATTASGNVVPFPARARVGGVRE